MARKIACVSAKGGVGKTTTAINLGIALNNFGVDTIIFDANLTTPHLGVILGVPILPVTLHDVLKGRNEISEALYLHKSGTKVVPGSIALQDLKKLDPNKIKHALIDLNKESEIILVDSPAGLGRESMAVVKSSDEILVVTNPEMPALTDALKVIKLCEELNKKILGVVVTKTNSKNSDVPIKTIEAMLEQKVIGIIPEDRAVKYALSEKDAVVITHPRSAASIQYKKLAANLADKEYNETLAKSHSLTQAVLRFLGITKIKH